MMNGVYVGIRPATMPVLTIWKNNPSIDKDSKLLGTANLNNLSNGFSSIANPTVTNGERGKGYGLLFYKYVLDVMKKNLQSDDIQSPGSALMWAYLARDPKYKVYGVDAYGKSIPVIVDGKRLYSGDVTVYDDQNVIYLRCVRK
jgi:hypothetical protein